MDGYNICLPEIQRMKVMYVAAAAERPMTTRMTSTEGLARWMGGRAEQWSVPARFRPMTWRHYGQ